MNLINAFNALWDIASIEERKQWDAEGNGADVIAKLEQENKRLREALEEILADESVPSGNTGDYYGIMCDRLRCIQAIAKQALGGE